MVFVHMYGTVTGQKAAHHGDIFKQISVQVKTEW